MGGTKYDSKKPRMDLIPTEALVGMGEVLGFGAEKYGDHNWREGIEHSRLYAAAMRHLTSYWSGESVDPESGLSHLFHAMTNLAMMTASPDYDDRYRIDVDTKCPHLKKDDNCILSGSHCYYKGGDTYPPKCPRNEDKECETCRNFGYDEMCEICTNRDRWEF